MNTEIFDYNIEQWPIGIYASTPDRVIRKIEVTEKLTQKWAEGQGVLFMAHPIIDQHDINKGGATISLQTYMDEYFDFEAAKSLVEYLYKHNPELFETKPPMPAKEEELMNGRIENGDTFELVMDGSINGLSVGFTCAICEESQELETRYYRAVGTFPVCDRCRADLKEIVVSKRLTTEIEIKP